MRTMTPFLIALLVSGCIEADDELDTDEEALEGGTLADPWELQRAVKPDMNCTATLIAPRYAILAQHCTPSIDVGDRVFFYTTGPGPDRAVWRRVEQILVRQGAISPEDGYYHDVFGRIADLALLRLDSPAPTSSVPATLMWRYPGDDEPVTQVGQHENVGDPVTGILRQRAQFTVENGPQSGQVTFLWNVGEGGDSGGPIYWYRKILGIHHGRSWATSVPAHLTWILATIGFEWPYAASEPATYRYGTIFEAFGGVSEAVCQYASVHTPTDGYNYRSQTAACQLVKDITRVATVSGWSSAAK